MNRVHRTVAATAAACALIASAPVATASERDVGHESVQQNLQQKLDEVVGAGAVGALAEVRDGHAVWRGSSGTAERGKPREVPVRGRFRIGSVTKTFVATVVLQLAAERRLGLDDTVEQWLPDTVPDGKHITLRHLLNHTSGLYDFQDTLTMPPSPAFLDYRWRTWEPGEMVQAAVANPPTFEPPGSAYAYSNTGYLLLGQIIEQATGRSYAEQIEHRIIRPLRLHDTSLPGTYPRIRGPHPHGYLPVQHGENLRYVDFTEMNPTLFGAGGEIISSTKDLNRFFGALLDGRLLPGRLLDEMKTPGVEDSSYGLGLAWIDTTCGVRVYGNDGDAVAYQAWSFSTEDGSRQATVALTPERPADPEETVDELLDDAFCD